MLLAVSFLAASLIFGATAPTPTVTPTVPPTAAPSATPTLAPTATPAPTVAPSPVAPAVPTLGLPPTPTAAPTRSAVIQPVPGMPTSQLPFTVPGLSRDEGTFLVTAADDGSRAVYFIAGNARHSILQADLQLETQLNPLWPVRQASRDEVLGFLEGSPVGRARAGLLSGPAPASDATVETPAVDQPIAQPAVEQPVAAQPVAEQPAPEQPIAQPAMEQPVAAQPAIEQPQAQQPVVAEQPITEQPAAPQLSMDSAIDQITYVLRPGDNLTRLAERYNTSVQAILAANSITNANVIYVGKALIIPANSEPTTSADNATTTPIAATPEDSETTATTTYTVRAGDSAIGIARQFGVEVDALLAANRVADRNRVFVGQVLTIPTSES